MAQNVRNLIVLHVGIVASYEKATYYEIILVDLSISGRSSPTHQCYGVYYSMLRRS